MQQLWHYRPQTCSGDKKQFLSQIIRKYHIYPLTTGQWPVWSTTVTSISHKKWGRPTSE